MSLALVALIAVLFATGTYSMLSRSLTRIVVGIGLIGNGANLLLVVAGSRPGVPPIVGRLTGATDPIPQALVLTAIVIGFALQAFLLALAWRSWTLDGNDDVEDDVEDQRLADERRRRIRMDEAARRAERERALSGDDNVVAGAARRNPPADRRESAVSRLVPLLVVLPLVGAAVALLVRSSRPAQRTISITVLTATLGLSVAVLVDVDRNGPLVAHLGGWPGTFGISYVVDRLGGLMLVISSITMLAVLVFAIGERPRHPSPIFHPVYLVLAAGLAAGFSTGDLFHLFVSFEIMLMASYVLLTLDGDEGQVRAGTTYVVINTIESIVLLVAVGLVYASTGTLSMAELPSRLQALPGGVRDGLGLLLLVAFGLKAAVFPLFFWLPDSYPTRAARSRRCSPACSPRSGCTPCCEPRPCCSRAPTAPCSRGLPG